MVKRVDADKISREISTKYGIFMFFADSNTCPTGRRSD
jgi:hypothetical protein